MKKFFYLLLLCLCIAPATTSAAAVDQVRSLDTLTPAAAVVGNILHFELCQDIVLPAETLKKGSPVIGTIREVKKPGGWGCPGKITLEISTEKAPAFASLVQRGTPPNFFVQFSLLGGFIKGKPAAIHAGDTYPLALITSPSPSIAS